MTLGLIALRAAKEQLVAAIATIKDELKNPELAEQIKFEVYNLGSDFDDHLTELGNAMPRMFKDKTAQVERSNIEGGLHLLDPTQENGLIAAGTYPDGRPLTDGASDGNSIYDPPATDGNPALEPGIDAPIPSPEVLAKLEAANHNDPDSDSNQGHGVPSNIQEAEAAGSPSAEDLDKVDAEQKAMIATGERIKALGEKIREHLA